MPVSPGLPPFFDPSTLSYTCPFSVYRVLPGPLCDVAMPVSLGLPPFFDPSMHVTHVHSLYRVLPGPLCDVAMPVSLGLPPFFDPSSLHMSILCTVFFLVHSVMLLCQFPWVCLPYLTTPRYTCPFSVPCSSWSTL